MSRGVTQSGRDVGLLPYLAPLLFTPTCRRRQPRQPSRLSPAATPLPPPPPSCRLSQSCGGSLSVSQSLFSTRFLLYMLSLTTLMKNGIGCTDARIPPEAPLSPFQTFQPQVCPETPKATRPQSFPQLLLHAHRPPDSLCLRPLLRQHRRLLLNHLPVFPRPRFPALPALLCLQFHLPRKLVSFYSIRSQIHSALRSSINTPTGTPSTSSSTINNPLDTQVSTSYHHFSSTVNIPSDTQSAEGNVGTGPGTGTSSVFHDTFEYT